MATNEVIMFKHWLVLREIEKQPITKEMTYCQCAGCKLARARRYEAERAEERLKA
jgi:hypothetical protein